MCVCGGHSVYKVSLFLFTAWGARDACWTGTNEDASSAFVMRVGTPTGVPAHVQIREVSNLAWTSAAKRESEASVGVTPSKELCKCVTSTGILSKGRT